MRANFDALPKTPANYVALSPLSFLTRAAYVYSNDTAVIYGTTRRSWAQVQQRCRAVASALRARGIKKGDTVSVLLPNIPEMFELHYAVAMSGGVLNTINIRLEADTIAYILEHADSRLVIADSSLEPVLRAAFDINGAVLPVIEVADAEAGLSATFGTETYEDLVVSGDATDPGLLPEDEWDAIALNYTSGTSGRPKGVVYHHRGAYLMSMGTIAGWAVPNRPTYLSVVPMFHCNGWNHPWAMAMVGARMVFTRDATPTKLYAAIRDHGVTHFGAAPIILSALVDYHDAPSHAFDPPIHVFTAGAPPPAAVLEKTKTLGFDVMQVYGLTETYGHVTQCLWREDWNDLSGPEQAELQAMQGVSFPMLEESTVMDRDTGQPVAADGVHQGEIALRGNVVMKGYYKNAQATAEAFEGGYFWSGDAAVIQSSGYIQIRDRLKDVIISGGENISSVEIEGALHRHAAVQAAAVVAMPSAKWGESPCAFVERRPGTDVSEAEIIAHCREKLAGFKVPKKVVFENLPKTATGKIQKFVLRAKAKDFYVD